jgi:hypothetical protein
MGRETKKQRFLRMHPRINSLMHIPNKILRKLIGDKAYEKMKGRLKK